MTPLETIDQLRNQVEELRLTLLNLMSTREAQETGAIREIILANDELQSVRHWMGEVKGKFTPVELPKIVKA